MFTLRSPDSAQRQNPIPSVKLAEGFLALLESWWATPVFRDEYFLVCRLTPTQRELTANPQVWKNCFGAENGAMRISEGSTGSQAGLSFK